MSTINERISICIESSGLTKTAFADRIKVSQQYVSKLTKEGIPSDRTISDICREFDVNEAWLRTGEGEMFIKLSRDEEIAEFMGEILKDEQPDFRRRLISVLARMTPEEWAMLERKAMELVEELKKD